MTCILKASNPVNEIKDGITIREVWDRLGLPNPPTSDKCVVRSPFREDRTPSFSVFEQGRAWNDFGTGEGGDVISFYAKAKSISNGEAIREMAGFLGINKLSNGKVKSPVKASGNHSSKPSSKPLQAVGTHAIDDLGRGTHQQWKQLARQRGLPWPLSFHGLGLAVDNGTLLAGVLRTHEAKFDCWFSIDQTKYCIIARRIDGGLLPAKGGEVKAKCLAGSNTQWPIGIKEAHDKPILLLTEGGPDTLAAWAAIFEEHRWGDAAVITMASSSPSIHEKALPLFKGKVVRIFMDNGEPGKKAAKRWSQQFCQSGATVDIVNFREVEGITDLEEFMRLNDGRRSVELNGTLLVPKESGDHAC